MRFVRAKEFTGRRPWEALNIAEIDGVTARLHWTDQPYIWHVNDGPEVFVLLTGEVDMHFRRAGEEAQIRRMLPGDICHAEEGDEHVAHPLAPSRILVIERKGSI